MKDLPRIDRRPPDQVMRLARLGSLHQSRLSFARTLLRRLASEDWRFDRPEFDLTPEGVGHAVYTVKGPDRTYALVAFCHDLPADKRSDRVIAEAWDMTFALHDGIPTPDEIARLRANVPLQEAGRVSERELSLSRANRSVRLWDHVVACLARGAQPDAKALAEVGYLMRTTAVYGSGKFGAADLETLTDRPEFSTPFQAEMLTVYLIRVAVRDVINHMAKARGGDRAVPLDAGLAQSLGIGNSTGLGMAPFLVNHPVLLNNWIMAREEALARVRRVMQATPEEQARFREVLTRSAQAVAGWRSEHPLQVEKLTALRSDLNRLQAHVATTDLSTPHAWDALVQWSETALSLEGQELLVSLLLEPYPQLVDGLTHCMSDSFDARFVLDGERTVGEVRTQLQESFGWTQSVDWTRPEATARVWYTSEEKLEPRLGERADEDLDPYALPLAPAYEAAQALRVLGDLPGDQTVADVLLQHPDLRNALRRAQISAIAPYGELRDNTIASDLLPIDMLRAKLSFFGATAFDPRSDRWVRISLFAGAPYPEDLTQDSADLWVYPKPVVQAAE